MNHPLLAGAPACVVIEIDSYLGVLATVALIGIPVIGVPLVAITARRHPSAAVRLHGRRFAGVLIHRCGLVIAAAGTLAFAYVIIAGTDPTVECDPTGTDPLAVVATLAMLVGTLMIGGGWALAIRASWVVLATLALLDGWIICISVINALVDQASISGVLFLAFVFHACCAIVAARWMFNGKELGPVDRAKAGEAGRTLSAVWIFLAGYSLLSIVRDEDGVFQSAASSAVLGALTVGALAVTMGSGYTKYVEAMNAGKSAMEARAGSAQATGSRRAKAAGHVAVPALGTGPDDADPAVAQTSSDATSMVYGAHSDSGPVDSASTGNSVSDESSVSDGSSVSNGSSVSDGSSSDGSSSDGS